MRAWLIAALLVAGGCKREEAPPPRPAPDGATSTAVQDALWKLAPDGAEAGIVLSERGLATLETTWQQTRRLMATIPELADIGAKIDAELTKSLGTPSLSLATLGMSASKGLAFFVWDEDRTDREILVITPVVDRDKFLKVAKGTKGKDADIVDDLTCKTVRGRYACAKPAELLDRIGKAPMGDKMKILGARGEIEMAGSFVDEGKPITMAFAAQLERGAITLRGAFKGAPPEVAALIKAAGTPPLDATKASGFVIMNLAPLLVRMPIPATPIVQGVTVAELVGQLDGPITIAMAPGSMTPDGRIPMKDAAPARKLVEQCASLPALAALGAKVTNSVCTIPLPQVLRDIDVWVEGKQLRVGKKGAPAPAPMPPSPIASELARGDWAFAIFGRGTFYGDGANFPAIPLDQMTDKARLGLQAMSLIDELGFGLRVDGDTVRMLASVRTAMSNPDDVIAKLLKIPPDHIITGQAAATAKQIAAGSPSSPFAADYKAGVGGIMVPTAVIGVIAAVAIPAYMDYMKKSKKTEGMLQLERLDKSLKLAHANKGVFPKGKVGPTPAKSCCDGPNRKCDDPAAWSNPVWKQLGFDMPDPHLFRYAYESNGKTFDAKAIADLDCDGIEITYVLHGAADANGNVTTTIVPPPPNSD